MNIISARKIPITELLSRMGHAVVFHRKEIEQWYYSPFRKESKPSFKVNTKINCWADFGIGGLYHKPHKIGGNIIDFAKHFQQDNCTKSALQFLEKYNFKNAITKIKKTETPSPMPLPQNRKKPGSIKLLRTCPLENKALIAYLIRRKINPAIASKHLQECYYQINGNSHGDVRQRPFFAACMQNDSKAWEVRSEYFKAVLDGKKDATTLRFTDDPHLHIFEGMMDFLSLLTVKKQDGLRGTAIILHSANLIRKAIFYAKQNDSKKIISCLDNDRAGEWAYGQLEESLPVYSLLRMNELYAGFKDLNGWLVGR